MTAPRTLFPAPHRSARVALFGDFADGTMDD